MKQIIGNVVTRDVKIQKIQNGLVWKRPPIAFYPLHRANSHESRCSLHWHRALPLKRLGLLLATVGLGYRCGFNLDGTLAVALEEAGAVEPRSLLGTSALELDDLVIHLHGETNVVKTVDETVLAELLDVEVREDGSVGLLDLLVHEVDLNL
jgi:hypothetical protein